MADHRCSTPCPSPVRIALRILAINLTAAFCAVAFASLHRAGTSPRAVLADARAALPGLLLAAVAASIYLTWRLARSEAREVTRRRDRDLRLAVYQEQLRSLASQLALVEARERKRIAAEIHDHIGQSLALTRIKLGALAGGPVTDEQAKVAGEAIALLEGLIRDTRILVFSVSCPLLYEVGLGAALEYLVRQFGATHVPAFTFASRGTIPPLHVDLAVLLFDVTKELMVNAVKHARARHVRVTLWERGGALNVRVHDNGVGFDPEARGRGGASGGYGLFSVRERLEHVRGTMEVRSREGRGTWVTVSVPVAASCASEATG